MAKKATDLLDVFRLGSAEAESRSTRAASSRRKKTPSRRAATADGLQLGGRQLLLASCIGVLLIVLAFTVGLGVGRKGLMDGGPKLDRQTATATRYWIQGELPSHDHLMDAPVNPQDVVADLKTMARIPARMVHIRAIPKSKYLVINLGPFATVAQADEFRKTRNLKMIRLRNGSPFRFAKVVPEDVLR